MDIDTRTVRIVRKVQATKPDLVTIKNLARRLGVKQSEALQLCEDNGLNVNVGFMVTGFNGMAMFHTIGEYSVEDLNAPYFGDAN